MKFTSKHPKVQTFVSNTPHPPHYPSIFKEGYQIYYGVLYAYQWQVLCAPLNMYIYELGHKIMLS